jgi:Ca-activated chloride channel family protein
MPLVSLKSPFLLALLALVVIAALAARSRRPPVAALVLRLLALALLIFALAAPQVMGLRGSQTIIFGVDLSDSIGPQARQQALDFMRAAAGHRRAGDRIGVVTFGADALIDEIPSLNPNLTATANPDGEATDLGQAILTAIAALPEGGQRRVILLTDGNSNRGNLDAALALAQNHDVEVSVVPLQPQQAAEVLVEEVTAPAEVQVGERFMVRISIQSTIAAQVDLRVNEGDTAVQRRVISVRPGRTLLTLARSAAREGLLAYTATMTATPDGTPENNRASAVVSVRGAPVVWYVARSPGIVLEALRAQRVRVRETAAESLPAAASGYRGVSAVVLDDVPATILSPAQMAALRDYVSILGGGLLTIGGLNSYGIGGYARTPLEETLPVSMDVRHRLAIPSMAVMLIIDTSGSMGSFGPQIAKVELAKETAQSVVDLLGDRDVIGVIGFDQESRWLVRPTQARFREQILAQVSRAQAGGGTNMHPAMVMAHDALRRSQARVKHVIVLSDGQTDPGDFQGLVNRMAQDKITVSSVAIGGDADLQIMQNLARWGSGRSYHAKDVYTIPQILTAEALLASRAYIIEERFVPELVRSDLLEDLRVPALRGYVATAPKPASSLHLISMQEDPILASWQFGLGRAIAFTSDAAPRWAAEWMTWPDLTRFWSRLVRWVMHDDGGTIALTLEPRPRGAELIVDAFTPAGLPIDGLDVQARIAGPSIPQTPVHVLQSAPGRYEAAIALERSGTYAVTVAARGRGFAAVRTTGLVVPYSPELRDLTTDRGTLLRIADATRGKVIEDPKDAMVPSRGGTHAAEVWPSLLGVALAAFVGEVVLRRVPTLGHHVRTQLGMVAARLRRQPTPEELEQERRYSEADRWKLIEPADQASSESMEAAAKLYIARLKTTQKDTHEKDEG